MRQGWIAFLCLFALSTSGCGLFTTREPEPPTGNTTGSDLAVQPGEVLELLMLAITLRDPDLYMSMIDQSFSYRAKPSAYPDDAAFFNTWDYDREERFARTLLSSGGSGLLPGDSLAELQFTPVTETEWGDSALYLENYRLEIHTVRGDIPQIFKGLAEFWLNRGSDGGWRILSWTDEAGGEAETMSTLRATL